MRSRHGRVDAVVFGLEGFQVSIDEGFALHGVGFLNEGLWHACAFTARACVVDEVGHGQSPAANHGHFPAELGHAVGNLSQFRANAVRQHHFSARLFGFEQLRGHVHVFDVEFFNRHGFHALGSQGFFQVFTTELAVVGGVRQNRDFLEAATCDGFFHDHGRLNAVVRCVAENVVVSKLRRFELLRHDGASGHVVENGNLGFLVKALRSQSHAGVDETHRRHDLFFVDQLLCNLHAALVFGFVVALYQLNLLAQHAAGFVDLGHSQLDAVAHAHAHRRRATGVGARHANFDGVGCVRNTSCKHDRSQGS